MAACSGNSSSETPAFSPPGWLSGPLNATTNCNPAASGFDADAEPGTNAGMCVSFSLNEQPPRLITRIEYDLTMRVGRTSSAPQSVPCRKKTRCKGR